MKYLSFLIVVLYLIPAVTSGQEKTDKAHIYQITINEMVPERIPIVNRTVGHIIGSDIDGDISKAFPVIREDPDDSSAVILRLICLEPARFVPTVNEFLASKDIKPFEADRAGSEEFSDLAPYAEAGRLIPLKRAPFRHSFIGNIFKKSQSVVISSLLFNDDHSLALVKVSQWAKRPRPHEPLAKIVILEKEGDSWHILGAVHEHRAGNASMSNRAQTIHSNN